VHWHERPRRHGNLSTPAADPVLIAFTLIDLALNPKAAKAGLKQLVQLDKSIGVAERKLADIERQAAEMQAALTARAAELDARERALTEREDAFAASAQDVRDELREHHAHLDDLHRLLVHRVAATAGIMWNETLQGPPSWQQLRQQIPDLPADLPVVSQPAVLPIDALSDTSDDPNADRHGHVFLGTLSRDVSHKGAA
jgi:hypothetical protein